MRLPAMMGFGFTVLQIAIKAHTFSALPMIRQENILAGEIESNYPAQYISLHRVSSWENRAHPCFVLEQTALPHGVVSNPLHPLRSPVP